MKFRLQLGLTCLAVCSLLVAIAPFFITGYHDYWTCALCRSNRTDYVYLRRSWGTNLEETPCTQWYREHVESSHDHVWVHGRASALRDLYGNRFGAIDRDPAGRAIWRMSPAGQLSVYEHFPDPQEARSLFLKLASPETKANAQDHEIMKALLAWQKSGFAAGWKAPTTSLKLEPGQGM